jgi:hypothetical protein
MKEKNSHSYSAKLYSHQRSYEILIHNDFDRLSFEIGGFQFEGASFDDFELKDAQIYSEEELSLFTLNKSCNELCNCRFEIMIPMIVMRKPSEKAQEIDLEMTLDLGKPAQNGGIENEELSLSINLGNQTFVGTANFFEDAFNKILKKMDSDYGMKNCFGCQFSDYSVYGQGLFGSMLCFRNQKESYSAVQSKEEYMNLQVHQAVVQEIYCCTEFELRKGNVGYRG